MVGAPHGPDRGYDLRARRPVPGGDGAQSGDLPGLLRGGRRLRRVLRALWRGGHRVRLPGADARRAAGAGARRLRLAPGALRRGPGGEGARPGAAGREARRAGRGSRLPSWRAGPGVRGAAPRGDRGGRGRAGGVPRRHGRGAARRSGGRPGGADRGAGGTERGRVRFAGGAFRGGAEGAGRLRLAGCPSGFRSGVGRVARRVSGVAVPYRAARRRRVPARAGGRAAPRAGRCGDGGGPARGRFAGIDRPGPGTAPRPAHGAGDIRARRGADAARGGPPGASRPRPDRRPRLRAHRGHRGAGPAPAGRRDRSSGGARRRGPGVGRGAACQGGAHRMALSRLAGGRAALAARPGAGRPHRPRGARTGARTGDLAGPCRPAPGGGDRGAGPALAGRVPGVRAGRARSGRRGPSMSHWPTRRRTRRASIRRRPCSARFRRCRFRPSTRRCTTRSAGCARSSPAPPRSGRPACCRRACGRTGRWRRTTWTRSGTAIMSRTFRPSMAGPPSGPAPWCGSRRAARRCTSRTATRRWRRFWGSSSTRSCSIRFPSPVRRRARRRASACAVRRCAPTRSAPAPGSSARPPASTRPNSPSCRCCSRPGAPGGWRRRWPMSRGSATRISSWSWRCTARASGRPRWPAPAPASRIRRRCCASARSSPWARC